MRKLVIKVWAVAINFPEPDRRPDLFFRYNYERESKGGSLCVFRTKRRATEVSKLIPYSKVVNYKLVPVLKEKK